MLFRKTSNKKIYYKKAGIPLYHEVLLPWNVNKLLLRSKEWFLKPNGTNSLVRGFVFQDVKTHQQEFMPTRQ